MNQETWKTAAGTLGLVVVLAGLAPCQEGAHDAEAIDWRYRAQPDPWTADSAQVNSFRLLIRDGWYNTSPSMILWKNYYWVAYLRGVGHNAGRGNTSLIVLRSNDLRRWHPVKLFEPPEGVLYPSGVGTSRLCADKDELYLFLRVLSSGEEDLPWPSGTPERFYLTSTSDGVTWSEPERTRMKDGGHFSAWSVRRHDGRFYSAVSPGVGLDLTVSEDGVDWTQHAPIAAQPPAGSNYFTEENDLHWRPDGEMWCVVRTGGSHMYWSQPPYTDWQGGVSLGWCAAPVICASGDQVYLGGRGPVKVVPKPDNIGGKKGATCIWRLTRGSVQPIVSFPAGGDASYPGLVSPEPGRLVVTFYSDYAYQMGVVKPKYHPEFRYKHSANDIYLAEIEVSP